MTFLVSHFMFSDAYPTSNDLSVNCTGQVSRERGNYDIILLPVMFGEAFTPVIREAVAFFLININEEDAQSTFFSLRKTFNLFEFNSFRPVNIDPVRTRDNIFTIGVSWHMECFFRM